MKLLRAGVAGMLLGILILEALLRLTENGRPWKRPFREDGTCILQHAAAVHDARTRYRFRPGWSGRFHFSGGRDAVSMRVNSLGFVSPEYPEAKPASTTRVTLVGDSMLTGLQVEADARFRVLLEGALAPAGPAQVLGLGLPGTGPVSSLNVYRDVARRFRPDALIVSVYTDNDFTDDVGVRWRDERDAAAPAPFARAPGTLGKLLKANSCLVMAAWALTSPGRREGSDPAVADAPTLATMSGWELAGVPQVAFEEALAVWDTLLAEAGADGVPVIMLLFPDRTVRTEGGGWDFARPATKLLHERLAEHFRGLGATVITGSDLLRRHTERHGAAPFTIWKNYLSREAHQTLAALTAERLGSVLADRRSPTR